MELTSIILTFVPVVILMALFFAFVIIPMIKQNKSSKALMESLAIGDTIVTNGGIRGLVTQITDDTVTIETGGNRTKMIVEKWAIAK